MPECFIYGEENLPAAPSLFMPNRMDFAALEKIEKKLGGSEHVAYLVEEVLLTDPAILRKIKATSSSNIFFDFATVSGRKLREQISNLLKEGKHVVYVPGKPVANMGTISDVPMQLMTKLSALHISPAPIFVGQYRDNMREAYTTSLRYDTMRICFCPKLSSGPKAGDRILQAWFNASALCYDKHPLFERSVATMLVDSLRKHSNLELIDGLDNTRLPYFKLLGVAIALGRELKRIVAEPRVGIILPPGKGGVIANYACIIAGIIPVNINYTSSSAAFSSIIRQSGIKKFITAEAFMKKLPQFPWPINEHIIHLDRTLKGIGVAKIASWVAFARFAPKALIIKTLATESRSNNDELALLFTSGSSGEPKGVILTHRMLLCNCTQIFDRFVVTPGSSLLCSLPIFHSFGLMATTLLPVIYGFNMVTYPSPLEAKKLNELVEEHQCEFVAMTPTFARSMLRRANSNTFTSIKYFLVAAEKLQKDVSDEFYKKHNVRVLEGYGLTETSPCATLNVNEVGPSAEQPYFIQGYRFGSVGQLLPGIGIKITDPDDDSKELTLSQQGMIWLRGSNVFGGYIKRDGLNKEVLRDGWFKTGDLGYVDLSGILTIGGRRSRFSKVAGEMVPHEVVEQAIEELLTKQFGASETRQCAVVGIPDKQKGEAMVLLSTVHTEHLRQALDDIRTYLVTQGGLPRLWIPREIIIVECIPVLATGKLDLLACQVLTYESLGIQG